MENLSEAPDEADTVYQKRYKETKAELAKQSKTDAPKSDEEAIRSFATIASGAGDVNRWDAVPQATDDVDDDEWDD